MNGSLWHAPFQRARAQVDKSSPLRTVLELLRFATRPASARLMSFSLNLLLSTKKHKFDQLVAPILFSGLLCTSFVPEKKSIASNTGWLIMESLLFGASIFPTSWKSHYNHFLFLFAWTSLRMFYLPWFYYFTDSITSTSFIQNRPKFLFNFITPWHLTNSLIKYAAKRFRVHASN